jgi:hypothetical protein
MLSNSDSGSVCAIPNAKASGRLGKLAKVTLPDNSVKTYTVRDHCGTPNRIDVWMGISATCKCSTLIKGISVQWTWSIYNHNHI